MFTSRKEEKKKKGEWEEKHKWTGRGLEEAGVNNSLQGMITGVGAR